MRRKILCPQCGKVYTVIIRKSYTKYRRHWKCPYCGRVVTQQPRRFIKPFEKKTYQKTELTQFFKAPP